MVVLRQLAPISGGILITLLCLVLKENFPFTHYPMYSNFEDQTYYVWLGDAEGNPIPVQTTTGLRLGRIKKVYNTGLLEAREIAGAEFGKKPRKRDLTPDQRRAPADTTLLWIYESSSDRAKAILRAAAPLGLYQVDITIADNSVAETTPLRVGELTAEAMGTGSPAEK